MSAYAFIDPSACFRLPKSFNFGEYIETERELWALFPESDSKRVNFVQIGLTAQIYIESANHGELGPHETYILMPCADRTMKPIRMVAARRLTLSEYRMGHLTAIKLMGKVSEASDVMRQVGTQILGEEVLDEVQARLNEHERGESY